MTIVRTKHNVQKKYTILNNETLRDPKLSLEAVGLWARLLSRPDDWEISVQELKKSCGCGENKIYKLLNELIGLGYVYRSQTRKMKNKKSVFGKFEYIVFENREEMESFQKSFLLDDFQDAEIQDAENGGITNTVAKTNTEITKKENIQRKTEPPNPQGGVSYSLPEKEKKDRSAKLAISEEAKELVDYIQKKVKSSNANAISLTPDQLSRDRKAAQSLLMDLEKEHPSPQTSGAPPSLRDKLELAKRVVDASFDDDFWKNKITGVRYLKLKWGTLSAIVSQTRKSSLEERNRNESAEFTRRNPELYARGIISPGAASFDIRGKENSFRSVSYGDKNFWKKVEDFLKLNGYSFLKLENSQN